MKGKHTPGPWHRNIPPATKYVTVYRGRNTHVCDVIPSRGISPEEAEANLNMIVAGPQLLAQAEFADEEIGKHMAAIEAGEYEAALIVEILRDIQNRARRAIRVAETGRAE